jgi:hypothetical protein
MLFKASGIVSFLLGLLTVPTLYAETLPDQGRAKTEVLEQRLHQLEELVRQQQIIIEQLQANTRMIDSNDKEISPLEQDVEVIDSDISGLGISGFFDVQARSENRSDRTFEFGDLEVDLEYIHNAHYSASAALVWDGDQSAEVAVAVVDYHLFDDNIPPRGRIFTDPGFHLQLGRFDVPFGADYQYFAAVDRTNITAPLTTQRIQNGGFNGDGLRAYGTWNRIDGALFWTNSLYAENGYSVGGRIGVSLGNNIFSFHHRNTNRDIELGFSYLQDRNGDGSQRNRVYAADLTLRYEPIVLIGEYFDRNEDGMPAAEMDARLAQRDETAYHLSLLADMQSLWHHPLILFGRYERWIPEYDFLLDAEDDAVVYPVRDMTRVTVGLNYRFTDYFQLKLEYYDFLGEDTEVTDYEKSLALMQVVMSF